MVTGTAHVLGLENIYKPLTRAIADIHTLAFGFVYQL